MKEGVERVLSRYVTVELTFESPSFLEYIVVSGSAEKHFDYIFKDLVSLGYQPLLLAKAGREVIRVFTVGVKTPNVALYLALSLATIAAVAVTGYLNSLSFHECLGGAFGGISLSTAIFVLSVLAPLGLHELGHFLTSRRESIPTPLPMFIPAPLVSPLGTFGAVIAMRFLPRDRRSLALLGISGPLVGVATSSLALIVTLNLSPAVKMEELTCPEVSPVGFVPMLMYIAFAGGLIQHPEGTIILLHPAAFASMLLLLIHFANLLPVGQLDGGHVLRSLTSAEAHRVASLLTPVLIIAISIYVPAYRWLGLFSVIAILISGLRPHIGYSNQLSRLAAKERFYLSLTYLLLLFLSAPVPL